MPNQRTLAALAAALALAGCKKNADPAPTAEPAAGKPAAEAPAQLKEAEPNDSWQRAQAIPTRAQVSGDFTPKKGKVDDDWFKITPGPGVKLALQIELAPRGAAAPLDATLEVFDRDRNRIARNRSAAGDALSLRWLACNELCFVKLSGAAGAYTLTVLGQPPDAGWELEPNDRAVDANELKPGATVKGYLASPGDQDWFKLPLEVPRPGQFVRIELSSVPGVRAGLEVRSLDGALLADYRAAAEGEPLFIRNLSVAQAPPPSPSTSTSTTDAGEVDAGSDDAGIVDAGIVDAGVVDAGIVDAGVATQPAAPGYYLVVKSAWISRNKRGANAKDAYSLTATLENGPADLELEPNDDPQHATDLGPGLARSGYLAPAGDVDWYRVRAEKPSVLRVEVSALERADVELSVWSIPAGGKQQLLARANEGGVREGEVLPAVGIPAGDSFIKVESALREVDGKRARDTEDRQTLYKLTAQLLPDDGTLEREPNDAQHAQQVTLPATVRGFIWPRKDTDVFQFHIAEGHPPITIKVSAVRGVDLQLELRQLGPDGKPPGETIGTADAVKGEGEESIVAVPVKPGDYQVEVSSPRNKDASATQAYTLTIQ